MIYRYYICDSEDLFEKFNIIGELFSPPKAGDEYVYKDRSTKKNVYTGKKISKVLVNTDDAADMCLQLDDGAFVKLILM